jgi:dTDP-4-amino-4,6-dideoxygalactose transaminase
MSQLSYGINVALERLMDNIVTRRRDNYSYLFDNIPNSKKITPLYPNLPQGACPYLFPVLTENGVSVSQHLRSLGVPAATWPELPPSVIQNPQFDVAQRYAQQIITFPVHQDLSHKHLRQMVQLFDIT